MQEQAKSNATLTLELSLGKQGMMGPHRGGKREAAYTTPTLVSRDGSPGSTQVDTKLLSQPHRAHTIAT